MGWWNWSFTGQWCVWRCRKCFLFIIKGNTLEVTWGSTPWIFGVDINPWDYEVPKVHHVLFLNRYQTFLPRILHNCFETYQFKTGTKRQKCPHHGGISIIERFQTMSRPPYYVPCGPTTATPMKTLLKNWLCVLSNSFALIPIHPVTWN